MVWSPLQLMGSGTGRTPFDRLVRATGAVLDAAVHAELRIETRSVPLAGVGAAWSAGNAPRTVLRVG